MNDNKLYLELMDLCNEEDSAFYFKDYKLDENCYRIFNYRLASYSDFLKPSALECRGIMFEIDIFYSDMIRLTSRPMEKFFNLNENPMAMDLDLSNGNIDNITHKKDGSLISTYIHNHELRLKSKGSITSEQCCDAMEWLRINPEFYNDLWDITENNCTVNLEWCSPDNRIVIGYDDDHLSVLNVRDNDDGMYYGFEYLENRGGYPEVRKRWTGIEKPDNAKEFIDSIPSMTDNIEGFVVELKDGQKVKIKTDKYITLHHCKDNIHNPRRLFEAVVNEAVDDMKSLFYDDEESMYVINNMEKLVEPTYNHIISVVEKYYEDNKHLERKEYAIKGQKYTDGLFSLKMNLYLDKENDYKTFCCKHPELFGLNFKKEKE